MKPVVGLVLVCLGLSCLALVSVEGRRDVELQLVTGGDEAKPHEFPFMVHLDIWDRTYWRKNVRCDAVVIDNWHILTTARCVFERPAVELDKTLANPGQIFLRYACNDINNCETYYQATDVMVYKNGSTPIGLDHDIALIKTYEEIKFSRDLNKNGPLVYGVVYDCNAPGANCPRDCLESFEVTHVGWGNKDKDTTSHKLMKANMKINSNASCQSGYKRYNPERMICAGDANKNACKNDWGAPIVRKLSNGEFFLEGITSDVYNSCKKNTGAIYTKTTHYAEWIKNCLTMNDKCKKESEIISNSSIWRIIRLPDYSLPK